MVTIGFALMSVAFTIKVTGDGYAGAAVWFGLWAIAGIVETTAGK